MPSLNDGPDDLPSITKPAQLLNIEELTEQQQNAMTLQEAHERIQEAAYALATNYQNEIGGDYQGCVEVVTTILETTGASFNSSIGPMMVAASKPSACEACRVFFPESDAVEY